MGKKKAAADTAPPPKELSTSKERSQVGATPDVEASAVSDDPPIVRALKAIDDHYLEIEREYEREVQELQRKYTARQAPLLEQRQQLLSDARHADGKARLAGTPALERFWLQAMKHLPALEDQIEEWDEPVLVFLKDIRKDYLDQDDLRKGFKLSFHFRENPYFTNEVIWKEYHTEEASPYTGEIDTIEIKASEIDWKPGCNVTVETTTKKQKSGGAKKKGQKSKDKEEPRDSFFRNFFRHLRPDMPIPEDVNLDEARQLCDESDAEDDEEEMLGLLMENDYEIGCSVRDQLIPFAVRWYTGEACPEDDFEDDFDDEDYESEEDDDYDDDDEEDESVNRRHPPSRERRNGAGGKPVEQKRIPKAGAGENPKKDECKQQ